MLQRIQSVYLLLAGLLIFALFLFPVAHNVYINSVPSTISVTGVYQDVNGVQAHTQSFVALIAGTAIVGVLPFILIFLYKNRKQQIRMTAYSIVAEVAFIATLVMRVTNLSKLVPPPSSGSYWIGSVLPVIALVLLFMAIMGIRRDDKLVKSVDRLR